VAFYLTAWVTRRTIFSHLNIFIISAGGIMPDDARPCPCSSGLTSRWANDARGIPLARVCPKCRRDKLSHYRPEILSDPNYEADEDIDEV
jgi:hypothetical protein